MMINMIMEVGIALQMGGGGLDCRGVSVCVVVECGSCWQARPVTLAKRKANGPISAANLAIIHRFSQHFILF